VSRRSRPSPWWAVSPSVLLALAGLLLLPAVRPAAAQPAAAGGDSLRLPEQDVEAEPAEVVGVIHVTGNAGVDSARIVRTFEIPPGSRFSQEAVGRGIRKLFALGLFEDVTVDVAPRDGVVDLVIHVRERPRIAKLSFSGNEKKKTDELEKKLFLHPGETYSPVTTETQIDSLVKFYHDEGYPRATVTAVSDTVQGGTAVNLRFVVQEGRKLRITAIAFNGATAFPARRLRKQLKTHTKGFFGGGDIKDETFAEDTERLESYYHDNGYRDMRVTGHRLDTQADPRHLTLVFDVDEGRPYRIGTASWTGATQVPAAELQKLWTARPGSRYDKSRIDRAEQGAYGAYAERGYLYLRIDPVETVRDSSVVDVAFNVTEGQPSHVRWIQIAGNQATREHVIRRALAIHEGDLFKRSLLQRSQEELSRLGLFEQVNPDFTPTDSFDVDLIFRVKEKQVGTASAGAGYSGDAGLTGFIELGHNNVLGNGQSLSLHLERGAKRSDYFLSFTEPWFRGTPTLLGFTAFNTSTERDLYREDRRGASGRIGRPLPWLDFTRGSIGYQLEDVKISAIGDLATLSEQEKLAIAGLPVGKVQRTSSVTTDVVRNSTNNAFYPTRGSRLSLDQEFAGGPFGGTVHYNKHRLEQRWYFPSLLKGVTTMVRARGGLLAGYAGQHEPPPSYERFRLGGGSVTDPLRGYDDYQVVPDKFVTLVGTTIQTVTYIGPDGRPVTVRVPRTFEKVRYPGGRWMSLYTVEQQFPIAGPLHGVLFFDAGNTWDTWHDIRPFDLKMGAGAGFRMEIPLLGNIGFDYGYGFNRDDGARGKAHFLLGNVNF
jgi:outer membrane protein insertion porin family